MNDIDSKKKFIYENIKNIKDHFLLIDYINNNNIQYTENLNGYYLNISLLDDNIINGIYNIVNNLLDNEHMIIEYDNVIEHIEIITENKVDKKYKKINLTKNQIEMLKKII
jgi:hypothetical protein